MKCLILTKEVLLSLIFCIPFLYSQNQTDNNFIWKPDNEDDTYKNPIIFADYSDPDVIRVDDDFYMTSSSFSNFPGLPILHSKDLINWKIIGHAVQHYPIDSFKVPQYGNGIWAPSIRYHNNEFYIYFGDPDNGIFMTKTKNPVENWEPLHLVKKAKGWIDPCPFWDDDGEAYIVHAWANSRSGIKSILTLNKMSKDGKKILDEGKLIFDGHQNHPTIEGPKLYKRNGYYYIFAPAGGVKTGWQTVLRSKNIYGPYDDKIVMEQGSTKINGPHQGAWIELESDESWFIHFQDKDAYGRVVHLNPISWNDEWPLIGIDFDNNGIGEPVSFFNKPKLNQNSSIEIPKTSDDFENNKLGLQWQWEADYDKSWYSFNEGNLRLFSLPVSSKFINLRDVPNILGQKFPGPEFNVEIKLSFQPNEIGERTGLIVIGQDYMGVNISLTKEGLVLRQSICKDADKGMVEEIIDEYKINSGNIYLKIYAAYGEVCSAGFSSDGNDFKIIGKEFIAKPGRWVGARIGIYSISNKNSSKLGYTDFDWIKFER